MARKIFSLAVIAFLAISFFACTPAKDGTIMPSKALADLQKDMREKGKDISTSEEYSALRKELATAALEGLKTKDLDRAELYDYAEILSWADLKEDAARAYSKVAEGTDTFAREASKKLMYLEVPEVKDNPAKFEELIKAYRKKFPPTPEDGMGLYSPVAMLHRHYVDAGEYEKAIAVVADEIDSLNTEAPYFSYRLLGSAYETFIKAGKKDEIVNLLTDKKAAFDKIVADRGENVPEDEEEAKSYDLTTRSYNSISNAFQAGLTRIKIDGAEAPGFTFTHFFNTEPFKWEDLRGKVILVDFWATWCGPCIGTFPELREFYANYKDKGVVVLGVTSFQGSMSNHGKDRVTDLSEEEELALMPEFISHQEVTWPLAFSDRSCFDPEYGITGIPTSVIIDKKGTIRLFTHPANKDKIIELVDQLIEE